jgi:hypothetical protein
MQFFFISSNKSIKIDKNVVSDFSSRVDRDACSFAVAVLDFNRHGEGIDKSVVHEVEVLADFAGYAAVGEVDAVDAHSHNLEFVVRGLNRHPELRAARFKTDLRDILYLYRVKYLYLGNGIR